MLVKEKGLKELSACKVCHQNNLGFRKTLETQNKIVSFNKKRNTKAGVAVTFTLKTCRDNHEENMAMLI